MSNLVLKIKAQSTAPKSNTFHKDKCYRIERISDRVIRLIYVSPTGEETELDRTQVRPNTWAANTIKNWLGIGMADGQARSVFDWFRTHK